MACCNSSTDRGCRIILQPIIANPAASVKSEECGRIEVAIERLPLPERLRLYQDLPQLIGRNPEDLDWQRLGLEKFFQDDSSEDEIHDRV
jgi:hypothetical protein